MTQKRMEKIEGLEFWFATGSQHLYGPEVLEQVHRNSAEVVGGLNDSGKIPAPLKLKGVLTTPDEIRRICEAASTDPKCAGLVIWMHTFSPSKMWIGGLASLKVPFLHLHTQFNRDLPWSKIDMDFMNLNQAAHGDREAGHIHSRMRLNRKVVVGHWSDPDVQSGIGDWMRVARAWHDWQGGRIARIGDNMRQVAVTEGDKVAAEINLGFSVNGYGVGDVVAHIQSVSEGDVASLCEEYEGRYTMTDDLRRGGDRHDSVREAARIELGLRSFLAEGDFIGFTDTFEDLHGLRQLPGIAVQRLMAEGYGFGAEGDWKTAALLRAMKVIGHGLPGGTSFMEDYTYHLGPDNHLVLGSHMLEICESIADGKPSLEVHPLGIGGKEDPARLVFNAPAGEAVNVSLVDMGNRFRLLVNEVDVVAPPEPLPNLPVARAVWACRPDFKTACAAWLYAGGAHHTGFSYSVKTDHIQDLATIAGVELLVINGATHLQDFRQKIFINDHCYQGHPLAGRV